MGFTVRIAAMLVTLALLALPAAAGKIKRYTDDEGTLHIIDSEPADQAKAAQAGIPSFPAPVVQPPVEPEPPVEEGPEVAPEEAPAEQEEAPGA